MIPPRGTNSCHWDLPLLPLDLCLTILRKALSSRGCCDPSPVLLSGYLDRLLNPSVSIEIMGPMCSTGKNSAESSGQRGASVSLACGKLGTKTNCALMFRSCLAAFLGSGVVLLRNVRFHVKHAVQLHFKGLAFYRRESCAFMINASVDPTLYTGIVSFCLSGQF